MIKIRRIVIENPPGEDAQQVHNGLRDGMKSAVRLWQRDIAGRHFRDGASEKYGYQPRGRKYLNRKKRVWGHRRPLVYSGLTEKWVRYRVATPKVRKIGEGGLSARLPVKVPRYFFQYRGSGPNKFDELVRTLPEEYDAMFELIDTAIDRRLARARRRKVVTP